MIINNKTPELSMGQKLKMFREINNLSQEELGQKLNVSDKTISAWETGERDINLANAKLICELFDIPNSYFVFNENFEKIPFEKKTLIQEYIKTAEFRNNIETIISNCKQKIEDDGLTFKKEYLPVFDYDNKDFSSYGIFNQNSLPVKIIKSSGLRPTHAILFSVAILGNTGLVARTVARPLP
jgi:transcriptional regulator with XRE-family HTH domain